MTIINKYLFLFLLAFTTALTLNYGLLFRYGFIQETVASSRSQTNSSGRKTSRMNKEYYTITWYSPPVFLKFRPDAMYSGFQGCSYSNCKLTYNKSYAEYSDAIIFTSRYFPAKLKFDRPRHQIWIFYEHEPPYRYRHERYRWLPSNSFNWTMTYDQSMSDIHLPYGEITYKSKIENITDDQLMLRKNKTALLVMSHCNTPADRLKYVDQLRQYIEVDIFGRCGTKWDCGLRIKHDNCFEILNNYRFYLAFENSFCYNYFTEKVFENFDYNTVLIARGGRNGEIKQLLPKGTFISTDDFRNVQELGLFLRSMTEKTYLNILRRKQQFTSFRSYDFVFHKAMCEVCKRMNNAHMFMKTITDIENLVLSANFCVNRNDF